MNEPLLLGLLAQAWFDFSIFYFLFVNLVYLVLLLAAFFAIRADARGRPSLEGARRPLSNIAPPISVIAPAYNEQLSIVQSTKSFLMLSYPKHEVIVVNDGSRDATLAVLIEAFSLHEVEMQDAAAALTARTMPRRGRRRQKKDFQKDILPGIVHLKKREVTEDLQIFGKVGPAKRVGRKPKNAEPDLVSARPSCPTNVAQVASEGLVSALGWGQITRRCRKQRLPPGKVPFNSN